MRKKIVVWEKKKRGKKLTMSDNSESKIYKTTHISFICSQLNYSTNISKE